MNEDTNLVIQKTSEEELADALVLCDDPVEIKNIINKFELLKQKKDVIRTISNNNILDKATLMISTRLENNPDTFSNRELLDTAKVMSDLNTKAIAAEVPSVQINQQFNITKEETLTKESRDRVLDFIQGVLNPPTDIIDVNVEESEDNISE